VLAEGLAQIRGIRIDARKVATNILVFDVSGTGMEAPDFNQKLAARGVLGNAIGPDQMRLVTHLDVSKEDCLRALQVVRELCAQ
jgi:threonine aldolase